jgi:hypothetical protein
MMGWWFVVTKQTPIEIDTAFDNAAGLLATWETSVSGIEWLQKLVKEGKASQIAFNGYPNRFTAKAHVILPLIADGPPLHGGPEILGDDYVMPGNWTGNVTLHHDKIASCLLDQILTIDAWDQS